MTFYIELSSKSVGMGVNFALLKDNMSGDPIFFLLFYSKNKQLLRTDHNQKHPQSLVIVFAEG